MCSILLIQILRKTDITYNITRSDIQSLLYQLDNQGKNFIQFQSAMKEHDLDALLERLHRTT